MKKKKTVTIYIPVYNEENNINFLLESILGQKGNSFDLEKIVVVNDGSTDNTKEIVLKMSEKFSSIVLLDDGKRLGKIDRLNQIYKLNKSEILILFDGDLILDSSYVIERIIKEFSNVGVSLVGANKRPLRARTFAEKLINYFYELFYEMRKDIDHGDNIYNFSSCAYAITNSFAKKISYPKNIYPITKFTYFAALKKNLKFKFVEDACVYFRSPNNLKDYALQIHRFSNVKNINESYYGKWVREIYGISVKRKIYVTIKMIIMNPIMIPMAIVLRLIIIFIGNNRKSERIWELAQSSKELIYE